MTTPGMRAPSPDSAPGPYILAPDPHPLSPWKRWLHFWFPKADPTTLGFIRVCTGLLVLYVHLAYSLDLQNFFGKNGWYGVNFINRERHEGPSYIQPFGGGWAARLKVAQLSEFPHRRQAFMEFLRALPADEEARQKALRYLNRANSLENPDDFRRAMVYIMNIQTSQNLADYATVLAGGKVMTKDNTQDISNTFRQNTPSVFMNLPLEERVLVAVEAGEFWKTLNETKWTDLQDGRGYVLNYFYEIGLDTRQALVEYMNTLPQDPGERQKLLDYLEYWNSDPRQAHQIGHGIFSFWFHASNPTEMALIHTGVLVVILLFTIGLFTRVTSVLTWVATVSYIHRTQQVLFGMDTMQNILLFYLMIGNSGAALSVDRLIARYRATRASLRRSGAIDDVTRTFLAYPPPSASAGFAMRLIQVHFCFIYMAAGLSKLKGPAWWDGRAFWDVIANPEFTLMPYSWYSYTLYWVSSYKPLCYTVTILACWFTLFIEIGTPFFLWTRLRWFVILVATAMHAVIAVLMGLNLFELLMLIMLIAYLPDRCIRDRFRGVGLPRLTLRFNSSDSRQIVAAATAAAVDVDNQIAFVPEKSAHGVTLSPAATSAPFDGVQSLFTYLRLLSAFSLVLWMPGVRTLLERRFFPAADSPYDAGGSGMSADKTAAVKVKG